MLPFCRREESLSYSRFMERAMGMLLQNLIGVMPPCVQADIGGAARQVQVSS